MAEFQLVLQKLSEMRNLMENLNEVNMESRNDPCNSTSNDIFDHLCQKFENKKSDTVLLMTKLKSYIDTSVHSTDQCIDNMNMVCNFFNRLVIVPAISITKTMDGKRKCDTYPYRKTVDDINELIRIITDIETKISFSMGE
jgi:hypothetical protein